MFKKISFSVLCLLITCLSSSLFAQGDNIIKYGPYLQNLKETEVTIVWESSKPSIGWVELAPDDNTNFYNTERTQYFDVINGVKNIDFLHSVKIQGLKAGTTYRYRVYSREVLSHKFIYVVYDGWTAATDVYRQQPLKFITNDANKPETSFLMINDIHKRTNDIPQLLKVADYKTKDMVFFNGDMLSSFPDKETIFTGFMDTSVVLFAKEKPMYYARGNHETRGEFATSFQKYFSPKEPHLYYMFRQGPICFVVLDTGEDKPDSDIEYGGLSDYDNYRTEQAVWLEQAVQRDEYRNAKFRVIIAHMPPISDDAIWHGPQDVLDKFVPILNKSDVDLMLCGHLHRYIYFDPSSAIQFPILINAHRTIVKAETHNNTLNLEILDLEGKVVDKKTYTSK